MDKQAKKMDTKATQKNKEKSKKSNLHRIHTTIPAPHPPIHAIHQEEVQYKVFQKFGLNDTDIRSWFNGPALLTWSRGQNEYGADLGGRTRNWRDAGGGEVYWRDAGRI